MKRFLALFLACLSLSAFAGDRVVVCGWDELFIVDADAKTPEKLWSWKAKDQIPAALMKSFGTTDDCKPVDGGKKLLVSSSSGGCALLELPSGKALWTAKVRNAHSIEMLPGGRIMVASSIPGDALFLFDLKQADKILWQTSLHSAHGLIWDAGRKKLYALGFKELRTYSLKDWDSEIPSLTLESTMELPDEDGHDFRPVPNSAEIIFSTDKSVWLFDRDKTVIRPHPELKDKPLIKCVDIHPKTGRLMFNQASPEHWWGETLHFLNPESDLKMPGEHLYKARWLEECGLGCASWKNLQMKSGKI